MNNDLVKKILIDALCTTWSCERCHEFFKSDICMGNLDNTDANARNELIIRLYQKIDWMTDEDLPFQVELTEEDLIKMLTET